MQSVQALIDDNELYNAHQQLMSAIRRKDKKGLKAEALKLCLFGIEELGRKKSDPLEIGKYALKMQCDEDFVIQSLFKWPPEFFAEWRTLCLKDFQSPAVHGAITKLCIAYGLYPLAKYTISAGPVDGLAELVGGIPQPEKELVVYYAAISALSKKRIKMARCLLEEAENKNLLQAITQCVQCEVKSKRDAFLLIRELVEREFGRYEMKSALNELGGVFGVQQGNPLTSLLQGLTG